MKLFIEPNDVLMFRDGKPFSGGDDHFARGTCPPPPSTICGAFRSHILSLGWSEFDSFGSSNEMHIPEHIRKEIGTSHTIGSLTLKQFSLAKTGKTGVQPIYPMPKDISWQKSEDKKTMLMLSPHDLSNMNIKTDIPRGLLHMWYPVEEALEQSSGFLSISDMERYLLCKSPSNFIDQKEIFDSEDRTGIRKDKSVRSVEKGGLYSVRYFRFQRNAGFIVDIDGVQSLPKEGILRLGGDHRSARYTQTAWNEIPAEPIKKLVVTNMRFKLVLISPAIFANGWLPGGIDPKTMNGQVGGVDVKLVGACLGRPIGVGGFDIAKKSPKIMKRAVPAGSIYLFETKGNNINEIFDRVWLNSISDERMQEGFGISLIGGY